MIKQGRQLDKPGEESLKIRSLVLHPQEE